MIYQKWYIRNTHDENKVYRGDDYFGKPSIPIMGLGVHALNESGVPTELNDYLWFHLQYAEQFPQDFSLPNNDRLIEELNELVRCKLVIEKEGPYYGN